MCINDSNVTTMYSLNPAAAAADDDVRRPGDIMKVRRRPPLNSLFVSYPAQNALWVNTVTLTGQ